MTTLLTLLFNGVTYGVLLFVMAVGLSVTMGMMNFANMAHVSLAALGGYLAVSAMDHLGVPFLASLPMAFVGAMGFSWALERLVLRHFYDADVLVQVLLTLGLLFMSVSVLAWIWGPSFKPIRVPEFLSAQTELLGLHLERYRLFLLAIGTVLALALVFGLERTRFGAMVRACVDSRRAASGCGLNIQRIFALTFAIGGGLAGLGGALAANMVTLDPQFPLRYLIYMLILVSVGGMGSITGTLLASMLIGVGDVVGKYYVPQVGGVMIYLVAVVVMLLRPQGLLGKPA
ncbi:MAG TPA: branched-chain amino acid ABC transporter permease [Rubrivivax sp.]|nr:branched-chain amino acid ABC transporter permease [Rubrivivax sp.]